MPIEAVSKYGSALYTWIAIGGVIMTGIWSMFTAFDNIEDNGIEIIKIDSDIEQVKIDYKEDINVWGNRSDRRYHRQNKEHDDFIKMGISLNSRVRELEKEVSLLKGRLDKY